MKTNVAKIEDDFFAKPAISFKPHLGQRKGIKFILEHAAAGIFGDPGIGKSAMVLAAFKILKKQDLAHKMLVVAPLRPAYMVWTREVEKWLDFKDFKTVILHGPKKNDALASDADIYVTNYESLDWLLGATRTKSPITGRVTVTADLARFRSFGFDILVLDELSRVKHPQSGRHKAIRQIIGTFSRRIGLTGSPAANGLMDLFGQIFCLDQGRSFGPYITHFRSKYFVPSANGMDWNLRKGADKEIYDRIAPLVLRLDANDYIDMPEMVVNKIMFDLPPDVRRVYDRLEEDMIATLKDGKTVTAANAAVATMKCVAKGTEVLTDKGWKSIELIKNSDKLWDGVEWVKIDGLTYSGYKPVVKCFGVYMTPDHEVLTKSDWRQAQEILNAKSGERYDRANVRLPYSHRTSGQQTKIWHDGGSALEIEVYMRQNDNYGRQFSSIKSTREDAFLRLQTRGNFDSSSRHARHVIHSTARNVGWDDTKMPRCQQQGLVEIWRTRDKSLPSMVDIREFLAGYARRLCKSSDTRTEKREWQLQQAELSLGDAMGAKSKSTPYYFYRHAERQNDNFSSLKNIWHQISNTLYANFSSQNTKDKLVQTHVYDIINAGPRQRFTVRGSDGVPLIVHNCRQVTNGGLYLDKDLEALLKSGGLGKMIKRDWANLHTMKVDLVEDLVDELQGAPLLVAYDFQHDLDRLRARFRDVPYIGGGVTPKRASELEREWNLGRLPILLGHPQSIGHGLNLQGAGHHVCFHSLSYDFDTTDQFIRRVWRQGNVHNRVFVHYLLARDTIDEVIFWTLQAKDHTQRKLLDALRDMRRK